MLPIFFGNPCVQPRASACEAALKTNALAATLLFAHGQTTERTVTAAERLGLALGVTVRVLSYWGARASMKSGTDVLCTAAPFKITSRRRLIPYQRVARPRDLGVLP